jgi:hypothetical protein
LADAPLRARLDGRLTPGPDDGVSSPVQVDTARTGLQKRQPPGPVGSSTRLTAFWTGGPSPGSDPHSRRDLRPGQQPDIRPGRPDPAPSGPSRLGPDANSPAGSKWWPLGHNPGGSGSAAVGSGAVGSGAVGSGAVGSGAVGPGSVGPGTVGPGTVGPGTVGPGTVGPGTVGRSRPGAVGSGTVGPGTVGRSGPARLYPARSAQPCWVQPVDPARLNPARSGLARLVPARWFKPPLDAAAVDPAIRARRSGPIAPRPTGRLSSGGAVVFRFAGESCDCLIGRGGQQLERERATSGSRRSARQGLDPVLAGGRALCG